MNVVLYVAAVVLFLLAGVVAGADGTVGVAPIVMAYFGLAAFAAAHIVPR